MIPRDDRIRFFLRNHAVVAVAINDCDRIENFHWQTNTYIVNRMSINLLIIGVQRYYSKDDRSMLDLSIVYLLYQISTILLCI